MEPKLNQRPKWGAMGAQCSMLGVILVTATVVGLSGCQLPPVGQEQVPVVHAVQPVTQQHSIGQGLVPSPVRLKSKPDPNTPGFMRVNHSLHVTDQGIECSACHEIQDTGTPSMPDHDVCSTCHEIDIDNPGEDCAMCHVMSQEAIAAGDWFDISPVHPPKVDEFQFNHTGLDEASCTSCHKEAPTSTSTADFLGGNHATLFPELRKRGMDPTNCALCHSSISSQNVPDWHRRPDFHSTHGQEVQRIQEGLCLTCHTQKQCQTCHEQTPPESHKRPEWVHSHGKVGTFDEKACLLCHTEQSCTTCHQQQMPRDHNNFFRRRSHGQIAAWDRDRCMVCHKQDYCEACHIGSAPTIPKEDFHTSSTPCLVCHSPGSGVAPLRRHGPLPEESCLKCHRFE